MHRVKSRVSRFKSSSLITNAEHLERDLPSKVSLCAIGSCRSLDRLSNLRRPSPLMVTSRAKGVAKVYGKIFESIFDSSIMEESLHTRYLWQCLIVLADEDGIVDMTANALARKVNIPLSEVVDALAVLSSPDAGSRSQEEDGRRIVPLRESSDYGWRLVNHKKYRGIASREDRRKYRNEWMRENRLAGKGHEGEAHEHGVNRREQFVNRREQACTSVDTSESEAVSDTEAEAEKETSCSEPVKSTGSAADASPRLIEFPIKSPPGKPKAWHLTERRLETYIETFRLPRDEILAECRRAALWCSENSAKRKTERGMPSFMSRWLGRWNNTRNQNSGPGRGPWKRGAYETDITQVGRNEALSREIESELEEEFAAQRERSRLAVEQRKSSSETSA